MSTRGKDLFEARIEYPLKPKPTPKTKDYIFYFVPATDPYGGSARKFLSKFYAAHVATSVSSIEEMIGYLHDQVAVGVDHIHEVVIVAHANPRRMVLKLLEDASETRNSEYQYVTFESLAILQKDFAEEKFATFKRNRARVIEHLTDASWVTIRGCRFGQGTEAMYALYAFFGGRANVYAPRYYQFFGWQEIGWTAGEDAKKRGRPIGERPPRKFENRLDAHDHLVRQRFFPKDLHTDERKDAVVQSLADPGMFSETIALASATNPATDSTYTKLIADLDAKRIPETVTTKLAAVDHVLTERAIVEVVREHTFWKIHDQVTHCVR